MSATIQIEASDTTLYGTDNGVEGPALLFLNGAFGSQRDWTAIADQLGNRYRSVTFDARGRGRSPRAPLYSFDADLDDVAAVVESAGLDQPILVGWSHGAALAVRYAATHLKVVRALVLIDGAFPAAAPTPEEKEQARKIFRRLGPVMAVMAAFGRSGRMSGAQAAEMNIGLRVVLSTLERDFDALNCPVNFVVGTGKHYGSTEESCRAMRSTVQAIAERNPNVALYRTVRANHTQILSRCPEVVADAIEDVASRTGRSAAQREIGP